MTPTEFIKKWRAANLKERSAAQEHFLDLCRVLGESTPAEADPEGTWYCFERGASKLTGGNMFAEDVGLLPALLFTRMLEHAVASPLVI